MKNHLLIKVLSAIILAVFAGWLAGPDTQIWGIPLVKLFGLIGQLFLNALTLVVVPLVASSIITGTARMGAERSFGALGGKTFGYFVGTNLLGVVVGLTLCMLMVPGASTSPMAGSPELGQMAEMAVKSQGSGFDRIADILYKMIPSNILAVASQGQMLGLIGFSLLFGFFISKIDSRPGAVLLDFWNGIFQIMMAITKLVMKALPIGVFGLVAKVVATTGIETVTSVALYLATVIISLLAYSLIVLPLLLATVARVNPISHFRAVAPALFTAFSTSSSVASLPVAIDCLEQRVGVSNRICSFTAPLGTSLSLSGTALYQCVTVLFIAQVYGIDLSATNLFLVALMALLTSTGMAGIPSASLISIVVILNTVGLPAEGIGLILAVERILDMCRTTVNVLGNTCCAVLVARSEGEKDVLATPLNRQKAAG